MRKREKERERERKRVPVELCADLAISEGASASLSIVFFGDSSSDPSSFFPDCTLDSLRE